MMVVVGTSNNDGSGGYGGGRVQRYKKNWYLLIYQFIRLFYLCIHSFGANGDSAR